MKGSRQLLKQAPRPSLQALADPTSRHTRSTIFYSSSSTAPHHLPLDVAWLARRSSEAKHAATKTSKSNLFSDLLLLSESPNHGEGSNAPHKPAKGISDHEYQTRVGKACRVIVDSLPDFMQKGVVDLKDLEPDSASSSSSSRSRSGWSAKGLLPSLSPFLGQSLLRRSTWTSNGKAKAREDPAAVEDHPFDSLYHPSIAFEFRPPLPHITIGKSDHASSDASKSLSDPSRSGDDTGTSLDLIEEHSRGGPTIYFNGRTMYVASSHLLRHALSALFHGTSLHLESARFEGRSKAGSSWPGISPYIRRSTHSGTSSNASSSDASWHDKLIVRLRFEGISRVSSHPHTYTVIFKYEFDRNTGMIARHVVDNIQPVPGSKVWAGLTNAWGTLSPCGAGGGGGAASSRDSSACSSSKVVAAQEPKGAQ